MPIWDTEQLKRAISEGNIGAVSLDTNTFDASQCNLKWSVFLSLAQFRGTGVTYISTEVVAGEVRAHLERRAEEAAGKLRAAAREFDIAWNVVAVLPHAAAAIGATPNARAVAQTTLDQYVASTGAEVIPCAGHVDITELLEFYFSAAPPFASQADKKYEFPDALALMSLENWAKTRSKFVVAVSQDNGWKKYASKSDWVVVVNDLRSLLGTFNEEDTFVAKRVIAQLNQGEIQPLSEAIDEAIQRYVDDVYPDIDASTAFRYYVEYTGSSFNERGEIDLDTVDAVSSTAETITISFDAEFIIEAEATFSFYVRDEGEDIPIAGATASRKLDLTLPITVEVGRDEPSQLFDIDASGDLSITLDFGHVEPDDDEPKPDDWDDY